MIRLRKEYCLDLMCSIRNMAIKDKLESKSKNAIITDKLIYEATLLWGRESLQEMAELTFSINAVASEGYLKSSGQDGVYYAYNQARAGKRNFYIVTDLMTSIRNEVFYAEQLDKKVLSFFDLDTRMSRLKFHNGSFRDYKKEYEIALKAVEKEGYIAITDKNIRFERYIFA